MRVIASYEIATPRLPGEQRVANFPLRIVLFRWKIQKDHRREAR